MSDSTSWHLRIFTKNQPVFTKNHCTLSNALFNISVITFFCTAFVFLYDGQLTCTARDASFEALMSSRPRPSQSSGDLTGVASESFENYLQQSTSGKRLHNYGFMYAPFFDKLRDKEIAFLEIGLREGDSIELWNKFFRKATVYGIDKGAAHKGFKKFIGQAVQAESESLMVNVGDFERAEVKIFMGDQEDVSFLREVSAVIARESGGLEFVIDDGGHTMSQQMTAFTHLMPLVKPGGTYFMEDLETSYYQNTEWGCYGQVCGGGPPGKAGTTVAFFKSLIDVLNEDFQDGPNRKSEWGIGNYSVNPVDHMVGSIQCWRNMCALVKKKENSYF